jgi:hypothetical protein
MLAIAGIAAVALGASAAPAFAGGTPAPVPATVPPTTTPTTNPVITPHFGFHPPVVQPWQFDVQESSIGGVNVDDVEGSGALLMHLWTDNQLSPVLDRFQLGANSVTLWHQALPLPAVDLRTCTVTFDQQDARFAIVAGAGTGAHLRSLNGRFDLLGMVSFPLVRGRCPLAFISPFTIRSAIAHNRLGSTLPVPSFTDFAVQGRADVVRVTPVPVTPAPSPSYHSWAPTNDTTTAVPAA